MTKKRTTEQYETWLRQPFNSSFGCNYDAVLNYVSNTSSWNTKLNSYGVSNSWWTNTAVPKIKEILGDNAWLMFMGIIMAEGGSKKFRWINHTYGTGNPLTDLVSDCNKIVEVINSRSYPAATTAPEVPGGMPGGSACNASLQTMPNGSIGRYYMVMTLAGNAWVWGTSWAQNQYFGNPYDQIMDMIEACGGDPYNGGAVGSGPSGSGGSGDGGLDIGNMSADQFLNYIRDALTQGVEALQEFLAKLFPKAVYLNNSKFTVLGLRFRRYQQYLYLTYPWENFQMPDIGGGGEGGEGGGDGSTGSGSGNDADWYKNICSELDAIKNNGYCYDNIRPQPSLAAQRKADCSGFVGWICRNAFPGMWNGGYTNTATMKALFDKGQIGDVVFGGSQAYIRSRQGEVKAGDVILMGQSSSCGAGLSSHVAWVETPDKVWSMEWTNYQYNGPICKPLSYFLSTWWTPDRPYMCICRFK